MARVLLASIIVLALSSAACGGGGGSDCTAKKATKLTGTLAVKNFAFSPNCFTVASGSIISLTNDDPRGHTFTVRDADVDVVLPARGGTGKATAPAPGKYDFYCRLHPGMTGVIIVT